MKKTCFFIGPIGDKKSPIRDWSDQVLEYIITPVVTELDYENPKRADQIRGLSSISFEIMRRLVEDDLVVADLTEGNPNVFYELAIRHALKKPVAHLIREGDKIPFDVKDIGVIHVRMDSPRETDQVKQELKSHIQELEKNEAFIIPYIDRIEQLKQVFESHRTTSEKEDLINLLGRLDNIQFSVNDVKTDLANLIKQLTYKKREGPTTSTFVDKRLGKVELVKKRKSGKKK